MLVSEEMPLTVVTMRTWLYMCRAYIRGAADQVCNSHTTLVSCDHNIRCYYRPQENKEATENKKTRNKPMKTPSHGELKEPPGLVYFLGMFWFCLNGHLENGYATKDNDSHESGAVSQPRADEDEPKLR